MLKTEHFEILKFIEKEKKLEKVAEFFKLTERSIRYKIKEINSELNEEKIEIKKRIINSKLNSEDIDNLFHSDVDNYSYNPLEREELIILYTLLKKDSFTLREITDKLNISKSTIRGDLKNLKERLLKYNIKLLQDEKLKYYYEYTEKDCRYFLMTYLYNYIGFNKDCRGNIYRGSGYFKKIIFDNIKVDYILEIEAIYKRLRGVELPYTDETLNILVILMAISKKRVLRNSRLKITDVKILRTQTNYEKLKKFFADFDEKNILFFTDFLFRIGREEDYIFEKFPNWLEIVVAISKIIKSFEVEKEIVIKNIDALLNEVLYYIKPLIFRTKNKIVLKNSILKEVEELYPDILEFLKENFFYLEEVISEKISEEELAFLVPIFQKSLVNTSEVNKKAILLTTYKENIAVFLKESIESEFFIDIKEIYTLKSFKIENIKFENYDYIITTDSTNIDIKEISTIEVNPVLTEKDIKNLENMGLVKNKRMKMSELLKIVLENSSNVDVKTLMNKLSENFSDKIYNDIEKNKFSIDNFLNQNNIYATNYTNLESVLEYIENKIDRKKFVKKSFISEIEKNIKEKKLYSFINDKIVLIFKKPEYNSDTLGTHIINNRKDIEIENRRVNTFIFSFLDNEKTYRELIYAFVNLFHKNKNYESTTMTYNYLISNI
ncbi:MAG: transcription antiterminator [Fusobacterium sp.]|nr:transcription antiterminator [Fusobacterium sp.]